MVAEKLCGKSTSVFEGQLLLRSPFALLENCHVHCGAYVDPSYFTDESLSEVWNKSETSFPMCSRLET